MLDQAAPVAGTTDFEFEEGQILRIAQDKAWALDHQLNVQFYRHAVQNVAKSRESGRKIFDDKVYVRILIPSNKLLAIDTEATDEHKVRFAKQYQHFLSTGQQLLSGTSLSEMPGMTAARVMELQALKITTVEQLAGVADATINLIGTGGQDLKQSAIRFIAERKNTSQLADELETLRTELKAQMEANLKLATELQVAQATQVRTTDLGTIDTKAA